jgi:hypothetical protein
MWPLLLSVGNGLLLVDHPSFKGLAQRKSGGITFEISLGGLVTLWPTGESALVTILFF